MGLILLQNKNCTIPWTLPTVLSRNLAMFTIISSIVAANSTVYNTLEHTGLPQMPMLLVCCLRRLCAIGLDHKFRNGKDRIKTAPGVGAPGAENKSTSLCILTAESSNVRKYLFFHLCPVFFSQKLQNHLIDRIVSNNLRLHTQHRLLFRQVSFGLL